MTTRTANEEFLDAMIRHQIDLLRFGDKLRNDVFAILDGTEAQMRQMIRDIERRRVGFGTPAQVRRFERFLRDLLDVRRRAWASATDLWRNGIDDLAVREPDMTNEIVIAAAVVLLTPKLPKAAEMRALVARQPFNGRTLQQWAASEQRADLARIGSAVREGVTQGEKGVAISRRVLGTVSQQGRNGVTQTTRRNLNGLVRGSVNSTSNHARRRYYELNADVFDRELYVAVLDSKTTLTCANLDGRIFAIGEGPIPPVHHGCRSMRIAWMDPERMARRKAKFFTEQQILREFAQQEGIDVPKKRGDLPRGTKQRFDAFSKLRKAQLTGSVPAGTTFLQFFEMQSAEWKRDYLGAARYKLYQAGVGLEKYVEPSGRLISLSEVARRDAAAFRAAGLDPVST